MTSDDTFVSINVLLTITDVLVTDYSSVYHDYLLLDKPILFIPYDYDEFEEKLGFSYDYFSNLPGPAIYSFEEFISYVQRLSDGDDPHSEERQNLRDKLHAYMDGNSIERVVSVIDAVKENRPIASVEGVEIVQPDAKDNKQET